MASTSVVFEILAKDRASDKFDHLGRSIGGSTTKMSKFTGVMKTAGKAAAYGLGAGLVVAAGAAIKFTQAAAEDAQAQELLKGALERNADATADQVEHVEKWIDAVGRAKGVADDDLRPALGRLVTATHDVDEAQRLASLAMDVSAGTGKSLESVSTALMKAQNGQVSSLSRLGINTKNAAGETISMKEAVKRMADQFGGAASEKAQTFQGKMDRLKLALGEAGEKIGSKLLPYAEKFTDWIIQTAIPKLEKFIDQMDKGKGAGGRFADKMIEIRDALKKATKFVIDHKEELLKLSAAFLTVRTSVKLLTISTGILNAVMAANPLGLFIVAVAALSAGFVYAYKHSERFRAAADRLRQMFINAAARAVGFAVDMREKLVGAISTVIGWVNTLIAKVRELKDWLGSLDLGKLKEAASIIPGLGGLLGKTVAGGSSKSASQEWIGSLLKGVAKLRAAWLEFIGTVKKDQLAAAREAISDFRDRRNEFANFSGFRGNLFGADISGAAGATTTKDAQGNDVTTAGPTGLAALKAYAASERVKAEQLARDVAKLTDMGISQDLLDDLKSQGASGLAQIHALAEASQEEANQIFADMAAADLEYRKAGNEAASLMDAQLRQMAVVISGMAREVTAFAAAGPPTVNIALDLTGRTVVKTVKAEERATGHTYWYPVRI